MFANHSRGLAARPVSRRHVRVFIAAVAATVQIAAATPAGAAATTCRDADVAPAVGDLPTYADATLCLINEERAAAALPPLSRDRTLDTASAAYARRMVAESFFSHVAPDGADLVQRLAAAGYLPRGNTGRIGENLASAMGLLATPRNITAAWMASLGHRANILNGGFREIGVGVAPGSPAAATAGITVTTDFGTPDSARSHRARSRRNHRCGRRHQGRRRDGRRRARACRRAG